MSGPERRFRRALRREVQAQSNRVPAGGTGLIVAPGMEQRARQIAVDVGREAIARMSKAVADGDDATAIGARAGAFTDSAARITNGHVVWHCKRGCNACCHDRVFVTPPEALLIARGIRECQPPESLAEVVDGLRAKAEELSDPTLRQGSIRTACLFLGPEGECVAHEVRPIVCRAFASFDVESCRRHFDDPSEPVEQDSAAFIAGGAISAGLRVAATNAALDGELYELHAAVLVALLDPTAAERWRRGERLFDGCLRLDTTLEARAERS